MGEPGSGAGGEKPPLGVRHDGPPLHRQRGQQEHHLLEQASADTDL